MQQKNSNNMVKYCHPLLRCGALPQINVCMFSDGVIWIIHKELCNCCWTPAVLFSFFYYFLPSSTSTVVPDFHPKSCWSQAGCASAFSSLESEDVADPPFVAASWCERPNVWLACCYMMKTMMRKLKPPGSREGLQQRRIREFITAALPPLVAPLVCRLSLAGSAWSLSGSVRQKNVPPPPLPPSPS